MKLTPLDIKKQEFKKVLRGYDTVEVDAFLDTLSTEFSDLLRQVKEMREQAIESEVQLRDYKQKERDLQQVLMQAQENSARTIENARKEGELIIQESELKASQIVDHARMEVELIKALEADEEMSKREHHQGTGRDQFQIDEILKKL
jgi:cell division initiation protein